MLRPDLCGVVRSGDTIKALEAVRDMLAVDLETCAAYRDKAALYRQLGQVLVRLEQLRPPERKADVIDEISERRSARRAAARRSPRAKRPG